MRLRLLACALVAVIGAACRHPAQAAAKKPAQVGLVSVTAAALHVGGKKLRQATDHWPRAKNATRTRCSSRARGTES